MPAQVLTNVLLVVIPVILVWQIFFLSGITGELEKINETVNAIYRELNGVRHGLEQRGHLGSHL